MQLPFHFVSFLVLPPPENYFTGNKISVKAVLEISKTHTDLLKCMSPVELVPPAIFCAVIVALYLRRDASLLLPEGLVGVLLFN